MYSPAYAVEKDRAIIDPVIRENPFATIIFTSKLDHSPQSFHLPLILRGEKLIGHMARANQAWQEIDGEDVLIIFHGPHCYISPDWYGTHNSVPTWNYISIHVRGRADILHDEASLTEALVELGRSEDPRLDIVKNIDDHANLLRSIVAIKIEIKEIFGKFKLAQSKPVEERKNLIQKLKESKVPERLRVALAMEKTLGLSS